MFWVEHSAEGLCSVCSTLWECRSTVFQVQHPCGSTVLCVQHPVGVLCSMYSTLWEYCALCAAPLWEYCALCAALCRGTVLYVQHPCGSTVFCVQHPHGNTVLCVQHSVGVLCSVCSTLWEHCALCAAPMRILCSMCGTPLGALCSACSTTADAGVSYFMCSTLWTVLCEEHLIFKPPKDKAFFSSFRDEIIKTQWLYLENKSVSISAFILPLPQRPPASQQ